MIPAWNIELRRRKRIKRKCKLTPDAPVNLVASLSLTAGEYMIQPIGGTGIYLAKRSTASVGDPAIMIRSGERVNVKVGSVPVWVWCVEHPASVTVSPV